MNIFSFHLTLLTHCSLGLVPCWQLVVLKQYLCYDLRDKSFTLTAAVFREIIHLHFSLSESWTTVLSSFFPTFESKTALLIISCNVLFRRVLCFCFSLDSAGGNTSLSGIKPKR